MIVRNNFDATRTILAFIVVLAHIATLTQYQELHYGIFNADFAVKGFFAISGFLVMKSYITSKSFLQFAEKRARRIYPAYLATILFCILIGALTSKLNLSAFFTSSQTFMYFITNTSFLNFLSPTLPLTFEQNPLTSVNGSLWTIKIEICLYFCIPLIYFLFKKLGETKATILALTISIFWSYFFTNYYSGPKGAELARQFPGQLSYFVLGAYFSQNKFAFTNIFSISVLTLMLFIITLETPIRLVIEPIFYASIVIYFSTSAIKNLNFGRYGDLSYGIYLYHFPIIQTLIWTGLYKFNAILGVVVTLCLTILMSWCSWHFIEKKFLKRNSHYIAGV